MWMVVALRLDLRANLCPNGLRKPTYRPKFVWFANALFRGAKNGKNVGLKCNIARNGVGVVDDELNSFYHLKVACG